jgi:hypothetical protein
MSNFISRIYCVRPIFMSGVLRPASLATPTGGRSDEDHALAVSADVGFRVKYITVLPNDDRKCNVDDSGARFRLHEASGSVLDFRRCATGGIERDDLGVPWCPHLLDGSLSFCF